MRDDTNKELSHWADLITLCVNLLFPVIFDPLKTKEVNLKRNIGFCGTKKPTKLPVASYRPFCR